MVCIKCKQEISENLQKIIGHASFSTIAQVYIHQDIDTLLREMGKLKSKQKPAFRCRLLNLFTHNYSDFLRTEFRTTDGFFSIFWYSDVWIQAGFYDIPFPKVKDLLRIDVI